jgi:hypothetical protein
MDGQMTGWTTGRMDGKEDRRRRPPQQDKTTDIIMLEIRLVRCIHDQMDEWMHFFDECK